MLCSGGMLTKSLRVCVCVCGGGWVCVWVCGCVCVWVGVGVCVCYYGKESVNNYHIFISII